MSHESRKKIGAGAQGKGSGTGAMIEIDLSEIPENAVLSNRDKAAHSQERGLDTKWVQTEQMVDHAGNRERNDDPDK
jgi:hypothetical protein